MIVSIPRRLPILPPKQFEIDLTDAVDLCDRLHKKHRLKTRDNRTVPTLAFLRDLAEAIRKKLDVPEPPTHAAAWQFWIATYREYDAAAERHQTNAELTYWYKINAFALDEPQRAALAANLDRVKAQDTLHNGNFDPTDYQSMYSLVLRATGDEQQAVRARADAIERYMDKVGK